jgi:hypothetical protein
MTVADLLRELREIDPTKRLQISIDCWDCDILHVHDYEGFVSLEADAHVTIIGAGDAEDEGGA